MNGIQFITDDKGRKTAMVIDLKKHGAALQDFWDVVISEARMGEEDIPVQDVIAARAKRNSQLKSRA